MSAARTASKSPRPTGFASVTASARLHLCAVDEEPAVRTCHVAAVLAFTPGVRHAGDRMQVQFDHGPTAMWVYQELAHKDVALVNVGHDGGTVEVRNPQIVLGRHGFRGGRWMFGHGMPAALGISRGALHAAGSFARTGLKVACPSTPMLLKLIAVMSRLGIEAKPTEFSPRAAIAPAEVPAALERLGVADVAAQYRLLRETNVMGDKS
uniref:Uncharacterized protein n=2 Tax=unclassified Mycobacterium TaxID=2642494 RepID=A0A5Q5BST3_MYCSS